MKLSLSRLTARRSWSSGGESMLRELRVLGRPRAPAIAPPGRRDARAAERVAEEERGGERRVRSTSCPQ